MLPPGRPEAVGPGAPGWGASGALQPAEPPAAAEGAAAPPPPGGAASSSASVSAVEAAGPAISASVDALDVSAPAVRASCAATRPCHPAAAPPAPNPVSAAPCRSLQGGMSDANCAKAAEPVQKKLRQLREILGQYSGVGGCTQRQLVQRALQDLEFLADPANAPAICAWAPATEFRITPLLESFSEEVQRLADSTQPEEAAAAAKFFAARSADVKETLLAMPAQVGAGGCNSLGSADECTPPTECGCSEPRPPLQALAFQLLLATSGIAAERAAHIGAHASLLLAMQGAHGGSAPSCTAPSVAHLLLAHLCL